MSGYDANHHLRLRDNTWWCRYSVGGKMRQVSLRTDDVQAARRQRDELIANAIDERAGFTRPGVVRWEDAVSAFLKFQDSQVRQGALSQKAASRYECSLGKLSAVLEGKPLASINQATVLDYIEGRRDAMRAASTVRNDLTAWSKVMAHAAVRMEIPSNPLFGFQRDTYIGRDKDMLNPPDDVLCMEMIDMVEEWSPEMALLMTWLRETGMRLGEALNIERKDIHPCGTKATLRSETKRGKVREVELGRAAKMLPSMPATGRLFAGLPTSSAAVSTRYGQWQRQRLARGDKARRFRLHDLRHAYALATLIDDPALIYRLQGQLGHGSVTTTEGYTRFLKGEGSQRRYDRRTDLYGSLKG